jgi:DNA-binding CsgD family transcriptional regulator
MRSPPRTLSDVEDRLDVEWLIAKVTAQKLPGQIGPLTDRELQILAWRYGFDGGSMTLREIADVLGCSRERVRQIAAKCIRRLRLAAGLPAYGWQDEVAGIPAQAPPQKPLWDRVPVTMGDHCPQCLGGSWAWRGGCLARAASPSGAC